MGVGKYIILAIVVLLVGCTGSDIKDNFCGIHINFQYCKCAFHNEYCEAIGMSKSEAKTYVYEKYDEWKHPTEKEYGVIEKNGKLYINSKPGEVLDLTDADLPIWAMGRLATVGAQITVVGPPDSIIEGDQNVLLNGKPVARVGDATAHGGRVVNGSTKIFINGREAAIIGGYAVDPSVSPGPVPRVGGVIIG